MKDWKWYLIMWVSVWPVWYAVKALLNLPDFLMPGPQMVLQVLWEQRAEFAYHTGITVAEAMVGYLIANVLAITLAITFHYVPWFEAFATPWVVTVTKIPFVAIATILVITFSNVWAPVIIIIILITIYPLLANVLAGLKSADAVLLDRMKTLNASRWQVFKKILWPTAMPYYIAAHEIAFTGSFIGAIVAEWLFAQQGIGYLLTRSMMSYRADRLYALTIISAVLAVGSFILVKWYSEYHFRWKNKELV